RHRTAESLAGASARAAGARSADGRWVNRVLVGQEAEFCGLAEPERGSLLDLGMECFGRAGLKPAGFVAPTWHGSPPAGSLRARGLGLLETRFSVIRSGDGALRRALPLTWTPACGGREPAPTGGAAWLKASLRAPLVKVAVHPGDMAGSGAEKVLEMVMARGENIGYRE